MLDSLLDNLLCCRWGQQAQCTLAYRSQTLQRRIRRTDVSPMRSLLRSLLRTLLHTLLRNLLLSNRDLSLYLTCIQLHVQWRRKILMPVTEQCLESRMRARSTT